MLCSGTPYFWKSSVFSESPGFFGDRGLFGNRVSGSRILLGLFGSAGFPKNPGDREKSSRFYIEFFSCIFPCIFLPAIQRRRNWALERNTGASPPPSRRWHNTQQYKHFWMNIEHWRRKNKNNPCKTFLSFFTSLSFFLGGETDKKRDRRTDGQTFTPAPNTP